MIKPVIEGDTPMLKYVCDAPDCKSESGLLKTVSVTGPPGWMTLDGSGVEGQMIGITIHPLHLCSRACLVKVFIMHVEKRQPHAVSIY